jgi:hypothetical protein
MQVRTYRTQSGACYAADATASLTVPLRRLQRCIATRLTLRACRVRRARGHWSVCLEAIVSPVLSAPTAWSPPDRRVGYAVVRCRETASAVTVSSASTLRLALAAAVADLALESGIGLALFRGFSAGRRGE